MDKVQYTATLECGCTITGSAHPRSPMMASGERVELHCGRYGLQYPTKIDINKEVSDD